MKKTMDEICKNCGKPLKEHEYICTNCFEIIDLEKHEKVVDETVAEIGLVKFEGEKKGRINCKKCGAYLKVGSVQCNRCQHVISEKLFRIFAEQYREKQDEINVDNKSTGLKFACAILPFMALGMWLKYRKKDPTLAKICFTQFKDWFFLRAIAIGLLILVIT